MLITVTTAAAAAAAAGTDIIASSQRCRACPPPAHNGLLMIASRCNPLHALSVPRNAWSLLSASFIHVIILGTNQKKNKAYMEREQI